MSAGAIGPRKKRSQQKKRIRHSTRQTLNLRRLANLISTALCSNCGGVKQNHRACHHCGWYNGRQVFIIKTKSSSELLDA
ncbi:MAG: 50S ribosomal protein L32 [Candidatus Absconditabacterales bacterium]|nr:50S ribosomal protein L32 [Candidatus Absconditabacterales bacterium]